MEKLSVKGMIESVIDDLANNEPINNYMLKLQFIASYLKNGSFTHWLKEETDGYEAKDKVPAYRILKAQVKANLIIERGFNKFQISDHVMPLYPLGKELAEEISTVYLRESVIALAKLLASDGNIAYSITDYEKFKLSKVYQNCTILSAHKPLQKSDIELVIHKFKSALLEIFLEFNDAIFNDEIDFDIMAKKKEINKIVNQTINTGVYVENGTTTISDSTIIGGQNNLVTVSNEIKSKIEKLLPQIEEIANKLSDEQDEILNEINRIKTQLDKEKPKINILTSALQTINGILISVTGNVVTPSVMNSIQFILQMLGV
jgi:hypothetical protein